MNSILREASAKDMSEMFSFVFVPLRGILERKALTLGSGVAEQCILGLQALLEG